MTYVSSIGMGDFHLNHAELPTLGVHQTSDLCLARINRKFMYQLESIYMMNKGRGDVTVTLKKRGQRTTISSESLNALRVGSTDRFRGPFAKRRVDPGSVVIVDTNVTVPQRVEDTNADGILWQTDGPTGVTYPKQVGTVEYNDGKIDFTFENAVTLNVTAGYKHTDWSGFTTPVTFDLVAGGGAKRYIVIPDNAEAFYDGVRDEDELGFFAKLKANQEQTVLGLIVAYMGDVAELLLPPEKGEIYDFPYHTA